MKTIKQIGSSILLIFIFFMVFNSIIKKLPLNDSHKYILYLWLSFILFSTLIYLRAKYALERLTIKACIVNIYKGIANTIVFACIVLLYFILYDYVFLNENTVSFKTIVQEVFCSSNFLNTLSILIASMMEEFLLRYYTLGLLLLKKMNVYLAILISSIIFALLHVFFYNHLVLTYVLIMGLGFSLLYLLIENLGAVIGVHFAINFYINPNIEKRIYTPHSFSELMMDNIGTSVLVIIITISWIIKFHVLKKVPKQIPFSR